MRVLQLILIETGSYQTMGYRPLSGIGMRGNAVNALRSQTQDGKVITASAIAGVAGQILRPTTDTRGEVFIENGWNNERMSFMMAVEVDVDPTTGCNTIQYISGYTDRVGVVNGLHGQSLDPQMRMFFNNAIEVRGVLMRGPNGNYIQHRVIDNNQVLRGSSGNNFATVNKGQHSLRPMDLFLSAALAPGVNDTRPGFVQPIKMSKRHNTTASRFLERSVNALHSSNLDNTGYGDPITALKKAAGDVSEAEVETNEVFALFGQRTSLLDMGSISIGELTAFDPNAVAHGVLTVVMRPSHEQQLQNVPITQQLRNDPSALAKGYMSTGSSERWTGRSTEVLVATMLSNSVMATMSDLMMTKVAFTATNMTIDGAWEINIGGVKWLTKNIDTQPYIQLFINRLKTEILREITNNNVIGMMVSCVIDMFYDSRIVVQVEGGHPTPFVNPTFSDGLNSPMIGDGLRAVNDLSEDIIAIVDNLGQAPVENHGSYDRAPYSPAPSVSNAIGNPATDTSWGQSPI